MAVYDYKIQFYKLLSRTALHALCSISSVEAQASKLVARQPASTAIANRTRGRLHRAGFSTTSRYKVSFRLRRLRLRGLFTTVRVEKRLGRHSHDPWHITTR